MVLVDFNAPGSQPHGEELFEFRRVELQVDHFIDHGTDLQPLRHDTFLAYPVGGVSFFYDSLSALQITATESCTVSRHFPTISFVGRPRRHRRSFWPKPLWC